jgi:RHS repeat-associated protein
VTSGTVKERIYLGGYEIYRERADAPGATIDFERQTLHVVDSQRRVAMAETKTREGGVDVATPTTRWRFQLDNHLGSATLELDVTGKVISYEEYHPYGSTAFHTADGTAQVSAKRYRYTGKEKDDETGLYYHGARYYAPWLGRWTAADPAGVVDGTCVYKYANDEPTNLVDPTGRQAAPNLDPATAAKAAETALERAAQRWGTAKLLVEAAKTAAPAQAPAAEAAAASGLVEASAAIGQALALSAAAYLAVKLYMQRAGSIARYGNPFGPAGDLAFPVQAFLRDHPTTPEAPEASTSPKEKEKTKETPDEGPGTTVDVSPDTDTKDREKPKLGRIYATYTKYNEKTGRYYSGRTSAVIDLSKPLRPQALAAVKLRDANHHKDENLEPKDSGFRAAELEKFDVGKAVNYEDRYDDVAYLAIRGREQQLIDYYGGAQSDTAPKPPQTENAIRGYAKDNSFGMIFHEAANLRFRQELHPFTGDRGRTP